MDPRGASVRVSTAGALLALLGSLSACAAAPPPELARRLEATAIPPTELRAPVAAASAAAPATAPLPAPTTASTAEALAPSPAGACPAGMAEVPGGTFMMGSKDDEDARPVHRVTLDGFCLDVTPVTVRDYAGCSTCGETGTLRACNHPGTGKDDHPQNCVTWTDATAYCKSQGKTLPTEAQWEYAAAGGAEQRTWSLGSEPKSDTACVGRLSSKEKGTCPVGAYAAGAFGLKDMVGNVWEWVADGYGPYPRTAQKNPTGPASSDARGLRGGAWDRPFGYELRTSLRGNDRPDARVPWAGFRCAKAR
jgi:formylglycine-generating enzyme required for sulfatase activity